MNTNKAICNQQTLSFSRFVCFLLNSFFSSFFSSHHHPFLHTSLLCPFSSDLHTPCSPQAVWASPSARRSCSPSASSTPPLIRVRVPALALPCTTPPNRPFRFAFLLHSLVWSPPSSWSPVTRYPVRPLLFTFQSPPPPAY